MRKKQISIFIMGMFIINSLAGCGSSAPVTSSNPEPAQEESVAILSDTSASTETVSEEFESVPSSSIETETTEETVTKENDSFTKYIELYNQQRTDSAKKYYGSDWEAIAEYQIIHDYEMYDPERYTDYFGNPNTESDKDFEIPGYKGSIPYRLDADIDYEFSVQEGDLFDKEKFPLTSNFYGSSDPEIPVEDVQYFLLTENGISDTFVNGKNVVICFFIPDYEKDSSYTDESTWTINNVSQGDYSIVVEPVLVGTDE